MGEFLLQTCSHLTCLESAGNPQAPALPSPPSAPASWPLRPPGSLLLPSLGCPSS